MQPATLLPGENLSCTGSYTVTQADFAAQQAIVNTATASAQPPSGMPLNATDSASVPVSIAPPRIGVSKVLVSVSASAPYQVTYRFRVGNFGFVPLSDVQILENLRQTFPLPISFEVLSLTATGGLSVNPGFNGLDQTLLLNAGNTLPVGAEASIDLSLRLNPNGVTGLFNNVVIASASGPDGRTDSDDSVDGNVIDPDGNGEPDEQSPTPIELRRAVRSVATIPVDDPVALLLLVLAMSALAMRGLRRVG